MTRQEKMARFIDLIRQINTLSVEHFGHFVVKDEKVVEVFLTGGIKNLPEGKVKFESFEDKKDGYLFYYPWKAVVEKAGIRFTSLVDEDAAWALYV